VDAAVPGYRDQLGAGLATLGRAAAIRALGSLDRLAETDARLLPGHGEPLVNPAEAIGEARRRGRT
jgi:glyoxylase-like metal-dependent hydrolase (beta-lactamase superfamily II)